MTESMLSRQERERKREARRSLAIVLLAKVFRAALVVEAGAINEQKGLYRISPGDVMHLRRCIDEARSIVNEEGVIGS